MTSKLKFEDGLTITNEQFQVFAQVLPYTSRVANRNGTVTLWF